MTTTTKTTVGLNVRQEYKDNLLKLKPDNMTDTAFYEYLVDFSLMVESGFDKFIKTASEAHNAGLLKAAEDALDVKYAGEREALRIKYS